LKNITVGDQGISSALCLSIIHVLWVVNNCATEKIRVFKRC